MSHAATLLLHQEAEAMTIMGCTGAGSGVVTFYCNTDAAYSNANFSTVGRYEIKVRGASDNNTAAGLSVYVANSKVGALSYSGTALTEKTVVFDIASAAWKEVRLRLETDTGANNTLVDWFELSYVGPTPPLPPAPVPPSVGAFSSGSYRNLFKEMDSSITDAAVDNKVNQFWQSLFANGDDNLRVYYPFGSNANGPLAYIKDTGNDDIRSEGMSYGMMIAVQMNKQAEFNALWNFAKSFTQHQSGPRKGYFAWQVSTSGSMMDANPASDGEEYFATALFFAGNRWGNGTGIYNYTAEANAILNTMLHKEDMNGGVVDGVTNMFNRTQKMVVFTPYGSAASHTDPSYHLPAFYELWGRWAAGYNGQQAADRQFWLEAAAKSRQFFASTTHGTTALAPDYAEFSGAPNYTGNHGDFRYDAWRTAMNWGFDYAWFAADANQKTLTDRLHSFFKGQGIATYGNQFSLSGTALSSDHSPGLVACNAAAALAATNSQAWEFVRELWNLNPPTGRYRYYDGMLSYMSLLHAAGKFRIYGPGGPTGCTTQAVGSTIQAENWCEMSGVQTEPTSDTGGGQNVGWIDQGDWMTYKVNIPASGVYKVSYRVASLNGGGVIQFEKAGGNPVYGRIDVPSTGGWQNNWTTISHYVTLGAGEQKIGIVALSGGFNVNWLKIESAPPLATIQAESFTWMSGIQTESTTDTGGGLNVGYIDQWDWLTYESPVNILSSGAYIIEYRVASLNGGGSLKFEESGGSAFYGNIAVPPTGGWQSWTTINHTVTLAAGAHRFGIVANAGGWNLNWFRITKAH